MLPTTDSATLSLETRFQHRHHPAAVAAMVAVLAILLGLTAFRIYKNYSVPSTTFDWNNRGFSDFHNGAYFPAKAFVDGKSPYNLEVAKQYDMCRPTPPYSPVVFLIHAPLAILPLEIARAVFFVANFATIALIAYCSLSMSFQKFRWFDFLAITNLLLISRPGHITMFTGYFTAEIVVGCIVALHFAKHRPVVSGLGLVLASIKPNFVIPLVLLMLFRKNFKALAYGVLFSGLAAGVGLGWLSYHNSLEQVIQDIRGGQDALHVDPTEMPVNTWTRVDLLGMYAKVIDWVPDDKTYLMAMMLMIPAVGAFILPIASREKNPGATGLSALITSLALLLSLYHHSYDCLILAVPAIGVLFFGETTLPEVPRFWRWTVAGLVAVPAVNYASTKSIMDLFGLEPLSWNWQAVTLINGVCLLLALLILMLSTWPIKFEPPAKSK